MFKLLRNAVFYCLIFVVIVNCSGGNDGETTPTPAPDLTPTNPPTSTPTQAPVPPPTQAPTPNLGLEISGLDLVAFTENKDLLTVGSLTNGSELDLSTMPTNQVNVVAHTSDQAATGSVHFLLEGPLGIDRWENNPIYTMAVDSTNLDISQDQFPLGSYALTVTPYALPDMGGDSGASMRIAFTVVNTTPVDTPIAAENDRYDIDINTEYNSGSGSAISNNDTFDANEATFVVVQAPEHGQLTLESTGQFSYSPDLDFTGTDLYTYELRQGAETAQATVTLNVRDNSVPTFPTDSDNQGFTQMTPSSDSKLFYVSSSSGNDSNTCTSITSPCKSINAATEKLRADYPDHLYLKRGDTWTNENLNNVQSGRSAEEPAVIAFYGDSGARPILEGQAPLLAQYKRKINNIHIIGIHFYAYKMEPNDSRFTGSHSHEANLIFLGAFQNVHFEDNIFDHLEIVVQRDGTGSPTNFVFRRNIWTGAYWNNSANSFSYRPSNVYADGVEGLLFEENVIDSGGWNPEVTGAAGNMYNHNLYINYQTNGDKLELRNNIITRGSSHGVQLRGGGLAVDNFLGRNSIGLLLGYNKAELPTGRRAHAIRNVVSEAHSMIKNGSCQSANLCTQAVTGVEMGANGLGNYKLLDNIASGLAPNDIEWKEHYSELYTTGIRSVIRTEGATIEKSGNISYAFSDPNEGKDQGYLDPGRTLGDYSASLGGEPTFDSFMNTVLNRPLQQWDPAYSAESINAFIRDGFKIP